MTLRARDIRDRCKGRVDPQVMYCLEALAEQLGVHRQQMRMLAEMLDTQTNILNQLTQVATNMKAVTDRFTEMEHPDDGPPVTE